MINKIFCDKCGEELKVKMIKNKSFDEIKKVRDENWDLFNQSMEELLEWTPQFFKEVEGSNLIVNLPKYKVENKVYDLCEKCTEVFLKENIQKWLTKTK